MTVTEKLGNNRQQLVGGFSRAGRPQNAFNWGAAPFIFKWQYRKIQVSPIDLQPPHYKVKGSYIIFRSRLKNYNLLYDGSLSAQEPNLPLLV